jgi:serine/threonine protein kinase
MGSESVESAQREQQLDEVLFAYLKAVESGQKSDRRGWLDRYPELAAGLQSFFDDQDRVDGLAAPLRAAVRGEPPSVGPLAESSQLGDFRIVREVGRGGMGVVYEAEQISLGRRVALKVLPMAGTLDPRQLQRFKNEAQTAAHLQHQNIVPVHFVGCERGVHFYAMQFIEGQTLAAVIQELRQLAKPQAPAEPVGALASDMASGRWAPPGPAADAKPTSDYVPAPAAETMTQAAATISTERSRKGSAFYRTVANLGVQAAEALEYAHQSGVVHRDVKPANLLVDAGGRVWVTDFGLARLQSDAGLTLIGGLVGTLRYMSPEQALAQRVLIDHRTDVYSLGATLYELLTLQPAFTGSDRQELLRQIAFEEPRSPRRLNRAIPAELETIVLKALEKNPAERYATAQELADDLRRFLEDRPIRARRPTLLQWLSKWSRRHRGVVAAALVWLVAALTVLEGSVGWVLRDHAARRDEAGRQTRDALVGARTAIVARDLILARQCVDVAEARLGTERASLPGLAADIDRIRDEIEARQADEKRFQDFLKLTGDAQDMLSCVRELEGDLKAREALDLYDVLAEDEWVPRLEKSYLTDTQKRQVREIAYVTLVSLADYEVRSDEPYHPRSAPRSLDLLRRAQAFHEPTRVFYFVRRGCHRLQGNTAAAEADQKQFQASVARTAWDYYLPGHTAGRNGDLEEAIRSYNKALAMQRNHFNSFFFLAERLADDKIKRYAEALQLYTGCIALRPNYVLAYTNRAECHQKLDQLDAAEADYSAAIEAATDERYRIVAFVKRYTFYQALGRWEKARQDLAQLIQLSKRWLENAKTSPDLGPDHPDTLRNMNNLAVAYHDAGSLPEAIVVNKELLERRMSKFGPDYPDTLESMNSLASAYQDAGQLEKAIRLYGQTLEKRKAKLGPDHPDTLTSMLNLANAYQDAGKLDQADRLLCDFLQHRRKQDRPLVADPGIPVRLDPSSRLKQRKQRPDTAAVLENLSLNLLKRQQPADSAGVLAGPSLNLLKQQRYTQAEQLLRECLAIRARRLPDSWQRFNVMSQLGGKLLDLKQYALAEPLLRQGYKGMKQREIQNPRIGKRRLAEVIEQLVRLYEATQQPKQARVWREKLSEEKSRPSSE